MSTFINDDIPILNDKSILLNQIYYVSAISIASRPYNKLTELLVMYSIVRTKQMIERIIDESTQYLLDIYKKLTKFKTYFNKVNVLPTTPDEQKNELVYSLVIDKLCIGKDLLDVMMYIHICLNNEFDNLTKPISVKNMCSQIIEKNLSLLQTDTDVDKTVVTNWDNLSTTFKILTKDLILLPKVLYGKRAITFYKLYDNWYLPRKKAIDEESRRIKEAEDTKKREQVEKRRVAATNRKNQKQEQVNNDSYSDTPSNIQEQVAHVLDNANVRRVTRSMRRVLETQQPENLRRDIAEQALEAAQRLDGLLDIINNQGEAQIQVPIIIEPPPEPVQINRILAPPQGNVGRYRIRE